MFWGKTPDPETGMYYGSIYATHVSPGALDVGGDGWNDDIRDSYLREVENTLRAKVEACLEARAIARDMYAADKEWVIAAIEDLVEDWRETDEIDDDLLREVVEAITQDDCIDSTDWSYSGEGYEILYDGNDNSISVLRSPYVAYVRRASPCFNGGYLEAHPYADMWAYCLGPEYFDEYNPCPYVPVLYEDWKGMDVFTLVVIEKEACEFEAEE